MRGKREQRRRGGVCVDVRERGESIRGYQLGSGIFVAV